MVDLEEGGKMISSSFLGRELCNEVENWRCVLFLLLQSCMDFR